MNNPYQILIFAAPFYVAGTTMLMQRGQAGMVAEAAAGGRVPTSFQILTISEGTVHTLGVVSLLLGFAITCFYFHLRKLIKRDNLVPNSRNA